MKNQGVWIIKIISIVICAFVIVFMGYHIISAFYDPIRTVSAVLLETEDTAAVDGVFIRDEALFTLPGGTLRFAVNDGERVGKDQVYATVYQNDDSLKAGIEISKLKKRLTQLENIANRAVAIGDSVTLQAQIKLSLYAMQNTYGNGLFLSLEQDQAEVRAALFSKEYSLNRRDDIEAMIDEINEQINALSKVTQNASAVLRSQLTGLFSSFTDGGELFWNLDAVSGMTSTEFLSAINEFREIPTGSNAKIVSGNTYQYAFVLPENVARRLKKTEVFRFVDEVSVFSMNMNIIKIGIAENGYCVVTVESDRYMARFLNKRRISADILFSKHSGVRIPRDAVRVDEEGSYVYCLVLGQVVRKPVTIIGEVERENYYLAEYAPSSTKYLLPGDEIITVGKDLYDGKVIGQ